MWPLSAAGYINFWYLVIRVRENMVVLHAESGTKVLVIPRKSGKFCELYICIRV